MRAYILCIVLFCGQSAAMAMDFASFESLADYSIRQTGSGVAGDIDGLIAMQERLHEIGMQGAQDYIENQAEGSLDPLVLTLNNAVAMKKMTLDEIEAQWHEGAILAANGIDKDKIDHFGPVMSLMDAMIHPATAYIALQSYKKTGDPELLSRAKMELVEVLIHLNQLQSQQVQVSKNP